MKLVIKEVAKEDIKSIYKYSFVNFGEKKAEEYFAGLDERINKIATGFVASTDYSFARQGLRRTNYESHAIYYRVENQETVIVLRVLGKNMEVVRHI